MAFPIPQVFIWTAGIFSFEFWRWWGEGCFYLRLETSQTVAAWILLNAALGNINMEFIYRKLTYAEGVSVNKAVCCFYPRILSRY